MTISIITATWNSAETIASCMNSVQQQVYLNVEHIIIDGQSNDDTLSIIEKYPHVSKVISEPDKGIYDALNKGFKMASGDIIGILHSDDYFASNFILSKIAAAFNLSGTDSVYGDLQYVAREHSEKIVRHWKSGDFSPRRFLNGWMPPHPTFFVKRKIYEKYGYFDLDFKTAADYELMLRLLYKHRISTKYIPNVLVKMRVGGQSNHSLKNRFLANKEDAMAWKKNGLIPRFYTTLLKPTRKIIQYLNH